MSISTVANSILELQHICGILRVYAIFVTDFQSVYSGLSVRICKSYSSLSISNTQCSKWCNTTGAEGGGGDDFNSLLQKLLVDQLVKESFALYGIYRFSTYFVHQISALRLRQNQINLVHILRLCFI